MKKINLDIPLLLGLGAVVLSGASGLLSARRDKLLLDKTVDKALKERGL
jgi:hypothetical protein